MAKDAEVKVGNRTLKLTNLDKVMYPEVGFTKAQVIDYYTRIAPVVLPHLKGRPLTLKRYPDGVDGPFFYEKQCPKHRPDWVKIASIWTESRGRDVEYCLAQDLPTLVWAANLADLELHTSLARAKEIHRPTMMVFDLDPGPPAGVTQCASIALDLKESFGSLGLDLYAKTSGSKGMQLYLPINRPVTYEETSGLAHAVAQWMEKRRPKEVTSKMKKDLRKGKVFVDWSQNALSKTTVCVYSLRARNRPTVSTPVEWSEVEKALKAEDPSLLTFETEDVLKRVSKKGDLFEHVLTKRQKLPALESLEG